MNGYLVGTVTSGTYGGVSKLDVTSAEELLRLVTATRRLAGNREADSAWSSGDGDRFRWTWSTILPDGSKITDMIVASEIH